MNQIKTLAQKWYDYLEFPMEYNEYFHKILLRDDIENTLLSKSCSEVNEMQDYEISLVYALASCENLKIKYDDAGISDEIFKDTMADIRIWAVDYLGRHKKGGLEHLGWIKHHLNFSIFRLGRLQFNFSPAERDYEPLGIKKDDNTLGVHIPRSEPFTPEVWEASFAMARNRMLLPKPKVSG